MFLKCLFLFISVFKCQALFFLCVHRQLRSCKLWNPNICELDWFEKAEVSPYLDNQFRFNQNIMSQSKHWQTWLFAVLQEKLTFFHLLWGDIYSRIYVFFAHLIKMLFDWNSEWKNWTKKHNNVYFCGENIHNYCKKTKAEPAVVLFFRIHEGETWYKSVTVGYREDHISAAGSEPLLSSETDLLKQIRTTVCCNPSHMLQDEQPVKHSSCQGLQSS